MTPVVSSDPPIDLSGIAKKYPALAEHLKNTVAQWGTGPGVMEFYQPDDTENPNAGKITLQFRDRNVNPAQIPDFAAADMLHYLGSSKSDGSTIDPYYGALRQQMLKSRSPQQMQADKENYDIEKKQFGDVGSYDDYMNKNRADAYMRGAIFPQINPEWSGFLSPQQRLIGNNALKYLMTPQNNAGLFGGNQ